MNRQALAAFAIAAFSALILPARAEEPAPTKYNRIRATLGYTFLTGTRAFGTHDLDEMSAALHYTHASESSFEWGASVSRVFLAAGSRVDTYGLTPMWGAEREGVHVYFGLIVGVSQIYDSYPVLAATPRGLDYAVTDVTRFTAGPLAGIDVAIFAGLFANGALQYAKFWGGGEDKLGTLALQAGLGYLF